MTHLLAQTYPHLFHIAHADAWPGLRRHGLLSTTALLDLFEVKGKLRSALERQRRPDSVVITHPLHGTATIRDQKPLVEKSLASALVDMTVGQWYRLLNRHVFLWPTEARMHTMLEAAAYRRLPQLVVTLATDEVIQSHRRRILLSRLNSGATRPFACQRGRHTFQTLAHYPLAERIRRCGKAAAVAEVLVKRGIVPLTDAALSAVIWVGGRPTQTVWTRPS